MQQDRTPFKSLATKYGDKALFLKVNVDNTKPLAQNLVVKAFPTFQVYLRSEKIDEMKGADPNALTAMVEAALAKATGAEAPSPYKNIPLAPELTSYNKLDLDKVMAGLEKAQTKILADEDIKSKALNPQEVKELKGPIQRVLRDRGFWHSSKITNFQMDVLTRLCQWPGGKCTWGLHMMRGATCHPAALKLIKDRILDQRVQNDPLSIFLSVARNGTKSTHKLLALRNVTNLYGKRRVAIALMPKIEPILDVLEDLASEEDKNLRSTMITLLANLAIALRFGKDVSTEKVRCLSLVNMMLDGNDEPKQKVNLLLTLGTLLYRDEAVKSAAKDLDTEALIGEVSKTYGSQTPNLNNIAAELLICCSANKDEKFE